MLLSAQDCDADLAERYGWVNRALPADEIDGFVSTLAHRIAGFPVSGLATIKERVNAIALAPAEEFRRDSDLFGQGVQKPEAQALIRTAIARGYQDRQAELALGPLLDGLDAG